VVMDGGICIVVWWRGSGRKGKMWRERGCGDPCCFVGVLERWGRQRMKRRRSQREKGGEEEDDWDGTRAKQLTRESVVCSDGAS